MCIFFHFFVISSLHNKGKKDAQRCIYASFKFKVIA